MSSFFSSHRRPWLPVAAFLAITAPVLAMVQVPASSVTSVTASAASQGDGLLAVGQGASAGGLKVQPGTLVTPRGHLRSPTAPPETLLTESRQQLAEARQSAPAGQRPQVAAPLAPPAGQLSFEGLSIPSCCARPPDTHGAVGLSHFVEVTNSRGVGIFLKSTGAVQSTISLASFFGYTTQTIFDPRVVYDKVWNRWVVVADAFPESSTVQRLMVAVSTTSNPLGSYFRYRFDLPEPGADDFFDFPMAGMDQDAVIITGNVFDSLAGGYLRTRMLGIPKAALYNGRGFSVPYFNLGAVGTVAPPIVEDGNSSAFLLGWNASAPSVLRLWRATSLGRSDASVALQANVAIPAVGPPPAAQQPGTSGLLDSLDGRFQNNSSQIGNQLLNIHTINVNGFPTPKWYQVNTTTNTVPAGQSGLVLESSFSDDFNPAIVGSAIGGTAANPIGRMFVTWNSTDANNPTTSLRHQVRVRGSGRLATDSTTIPAGANFAQASVPYNPTADVIERWGDYSAVSLDPVAVAGCPAGQRAWLVNERQVSSTRWGSRFGRMGFC